LLLFVVAAFTLIYTLSNTAAAPYERVEPPEPVIVEQDPDDDLDGEDDPENIEDDIDIEEEPELGPIDILGNNPAEDGFIFIEADESEIHKGYLLLVNHDHSYTIPSDLDLVNINQAKTVPFRVQHDSSQLARSIIEPLDEMMEAFMAATNFRAVAIISAHRNRESQQRILNNYINRMGRREALRWASLPGHSEHHTGLAFDFGVMHGNTRNSFPGTGTTGWFRRNAHKFGFILRYTQQKTHITQTSYEPWHYRYVGIPHSVIMFEKDLCLEEYIDFLREFSFEEPLEFEHNDINYIIYFTSDTQIKIPINSEYQISGNNIDGFIITAITYEVDEENAEEFAV